MAFSDDADFEMDDDFPEGDDAPPPEESSNRPFLIILLVGIAAIVLTLIFMIAYLVSRGQQNGSAEQTQNAIYATNTVIAGSYTQTAIAQAWTSTPTATELPPTATLTPTSVVALPTNTPTEAAASPTTDPRTATVQALLTLSAASTPFTPTPTGLPDTGFMDNVGAMGLIVAAMVLLVVIILARRLRAAS